MSFSANDTPCLLAKMMSDKPKGPGLVDELVDQLQSDRQNTPDDHYQRRERGINRRQGRMELMYGLIVMVVSIGALVAVTLRNPGSYFYVQTGLTFTGVLFGIGLMIHGLITSLRAH